LEELANFAFVTSDFNGKAGGLDVDNLGAEDVADLHDFWPSGSSGFDAKQNKFAVDDIPVFEVVDFENIDQFFELFDDLFQDLIVADDNDGHAGDLIVLGGSDVEGIDVEAAPTEKTCDAGEYPETVLNDDRDSMAHKLKGSEAIKSSEEGADGSSRRARLSEGGAQAG
jgi:hypothetical protein